MGSYTPGRINPPMLVAGCAGRRWGAVGGGGSLQVPLEDAYLAGSVLYFLAAKK